MHLIKTQITDFNMQDFEKTIMITGGCGFIGGNLVNYLHKTHPEWRIINVDSLTYAANPFYISVNLSSAWLNNYKMIVMDICSPDIDKVFEEEGITDVIHLAAESHVDNSIENPSLFAQVNILGTLNLLNAAVKHWKNDYSKHRFHLVSTDEVYGALKPGEPAFKETNKYFPHSPYSASKASADHFVRAYHDTYGLNITISNCSNNYGPNQHQEKLIPKTISRILNGEKVPIYGDGTNVRDWLFVRDHCTAIENIFLNGKNGETYNVGGNCEKNNLEIVAAICKCISTNPNPDDVITFVPDRKGHDFRYAIDNTKIKTELRWVPQTSFEEGMKKTVDWYIYGNL